ncbi:MAG: ABC transporter permease [Bryobacteraceae bacterium]
MSLWSRLTNIFRGAGMGRDIDEEFESHFAEAAAESRDPAEARRAFGSPLRYREESRDLRLIPWLDSLRADAVFGWRQLLKHKVTSAAAILSLALGVGACTGAFRLIDALLLRPLPVAAPDRIYDVFRHEIGWDGKPGTFDGWAYPAFQRMRAAVQDQAELIAISYAERVDLTYRSEQEIERAHVQYVSGWMFRAFGLQPAVGRLFTEADDLEPGAHPYAVLSHDYWTRRFARDPHIVGRTLRMGDRLYQIIGVARDPFVGTEPGTVIDIFLLAMMHPAAGRSDSTWHRTLAVMKPGVAVEAVRQRLDAVSIAFERERARGFTNVSQQNIENYLHQSVALVPAPGGVSDLQSANRQPLAALAMLVALVLLIACANVANLMTAQAASRAREMALRVSIGAGRWRLVQLVLVESTVLACLAGALGAMFAWWCAPLVVRMINPANDPARLLLPADWRVFGFGLLLTFAVGLLFGSGPALRASAVRPAGVLRGGDDPHARRRMMHALIALQVSFCFLVLFAAGLFVTTFQRLSHQTTGFSAKRLLTLDTVSQAAQPTVFWEQVADHLRAVPGVEAVALAGWPLLSGYAQNNSVSIHGGPPSDDLTYFLPISPGWLNVMEIPLLAGRDLLPGGRDDGAAIINDTFARRYFKGEDPIGQTFDETLDEGGRIPHRIVGLVRDARYQGIREPIPPVAYIPFHASRRGTFMVRTSTANPMALASILRREVSRARPEFRVSNIRTQQEINDALTIRERLLATLAMFFAVMALLLAGVGLYGVMDYSVLLRRREIGIRMAIGARAGSIAGLVARDVISMVLLGAIGGFALGRLSAHYIASLFYQVQAGDWDVLAFPSLVILGAALLAAMPAVVRAVRIDPAETLRAE